MTELDDRVRTLLETRALDVPVDPTMPVAVATRSRRRRTVVGIGVGLAAVAVLVSSAAALRAVLPQQQVGKDPSPTVSPSPDASPSPTLSPSPTAAPPAVPETFVGVREGEIVLVDAASGERIRVLVHRAALGGLPALDLEVAPDGSSVYYVPAGTPELIMRVPIRGGEPTLVAEGRKPTISPDGRKLAYVDCNSPFTGCGNAIAIRDLADGGTSVWDVGADAQWVGQMAWIDDRTLAFSMFYAGDSNPTMHVLDTVDGAGVQLGDVPKIGPDRIEAGWTVVGYHAPTDGLLVRHYCCSSGATDEVEESAVLSVAPNGEVIATLFEPADWLDVELDASRRHVLVADLGRDVYRIDASGEPVFVAGGYEDVDW